MLVPDQLGRCEEFYDKHKHCSDDLENVNRAKEVLTKCSAAEFIDLYQCDENMVNNED